MRVVVDLNRCQSYGQCVFAAPAVFEFRGEESLEYEAAPEEALRADVERAAAYCPVGAIRIQPAGIAPLAVVSGATESLSKNHLDRLEAAEPEGRSQTKLPLFARSACLSIGPAPGLAGSRTGLEQIVPEATGSAPTVKEPSGFGSADGRMPVPDGRAP